MDIQEVGWGGKHWIDLASDMGVLLWLRLWTFKVNKMREFLDCWETISFSGKTLLHVVS